MHRNIEKKELGIPREWKDGYMLQSWILQGQTCPCVDAGEMDQGHSQYFFPLVNSYPPSHLDT